MDDLVYGGSNTIRRTKCNSEQRTSFDVIVHSLTKYPTLNSRILLLCRNGCLGSSDVTLREQPSTVFTGINGVYETHGDLDGPVYWCLTTSWKRRKLGVSFDRRKPNKSFVEHHWVVLIHV